MTRDQALARARDLFPDAPIADVLAAADWLLRTDGAQVYPVAPGGAWWQVPYAPPLITCDTQIATTNGAYGPPVSLSGGEPDPAVMAGLVRALDAAGLRWQPDPDVPPVWLRVVRDPDDGTAGVPARVG